MVIVLHIWALSEYDVALLMFLLTTVQLFDDLLSSALVAITMVWIVASAMTPVLMWSESVLAIGALM